MATTPDTAAAPASGPKLTEILRDQFGWIVKVFGSAAVVTAFLMFAGFLSDYGAYRLAGLPRLNMTLTALIEQGADTVIDTFALLGGGTRGPVLALLLGAVVLFWGWCDSPRLRPFTRSVALYRLLRVLLLVVAVLVTASFVERIQRSLSGNHHSPQAIEEALREAYANEKVFPTPTSARWRWNARRTNCASTSRRTGGRALIGGWTRC